ncbi:MAG TPA: insulinase family protein, partial [Pseudomonadaceae bacterium]|nr:insulinase family protein [Pseudomonadaceae bacterium]
MLLPRSLRLPPALPETALGAPATALRASETALRAPGTTVLTRSCRALLTCRGLLSRALLISSTLLAPFTQAQAPALDSLPQEAFSIPLDATLGVAPPVITGEFANGLRYYILENREPENRAELRLVVNVGSTLESDDQLGLAHFLEHMAFNGTEHFAKQELIAFMESIGMRMGPGVNASTSFDETIYQLQLPTDNPDYLNTAFRIMEDWATGMTLDSEEIDLERGVVIEEWRQGQGAQARVRDQQLPVLLKDSRYAERLPIGTLDSLRNFDHEALRRFYQEWYRPELMAVVAVGDFDAATVEALVRRHFEDIPATSESPQERPQYQVP